MTDLNYLGTNNNLKNDTLTHVEFNQDYTCFIYTFNNEFCVWDCDSLKLRYNRIFKEDIGRATVLYKSRSIN